MKKLLRGWMFYTAVLLFLLAAGLTLPALCRDSFETAEQAISQAAAQLEEKAARGWNFP